VTPYDAHAIVEIAGRRIDSWADGSPIEGVHVELATGEASECELRVFDPDPDYAFINSITQDDGIGELVVRAWVGFGSVADLGQPVFKGLLARVEREHGTTVCRAYDMGFKMRKLQRTDQHNGATDLQIIEKLARRNGLGFQGPDQAVSLDKIKSSKQEGQTDWDKAAECAERAGLVLFVRGDTLFAKEAAKTANAPLLTLGFRQDFMLLDDFRVSYKVPENVEGRPAQVKVRVRGHGGSALEGASAKGQRGHERLEVKTDLPVKSKRAADKRAEARKALKREHAFTGEIGVLPSYSGRRADARDTVRLTGLPKLFNGNYLCDRVTHLFEPGALKMEMSLYRDIKA
jgi:phage protein D